MKNCPGWREASKDLDHEDQVWFRVQTKGLQVGGTGQAGSIGAMV